MKNLFEIFENYFNEWLYLYPFDASLMGFDILDKVEKIPVTISEEFKEREVNFYKKYKKILSDVKFENLNEKEKTQIKALKFTCDLFLKELSFPENLLPINHFYSLHLIFPSVSSGLNQIFKKKKDIDNFAKKINYFYDWAEEAIINLEKGIKSRVVLPSVIIEKILTQLESIIKTKKEKNPCFVCLSLIEKEYTGKDKEKEQKKIENEIKNKIIKSYENIYNFLKEKYQKKCRKEIGYYNLPDGIEWYKNKILRYTTLRLNPEEIFEFGLKELKKLKAEKIILNEEKNEKIEYIRFLNKYKENIKGKLKKHFESYPKRDFKILPIEKYKEGTSSLGEYFPGGFEEKLKPIFYLNLSLAKEKNLNEILSIFFHEAIPGHHLQISLQRENEKLPSFLRYHIFEVFVEGWALYSENLAYEIGLVKDKNYKSAVLKNQIWRTLRLILDTGIHTGKLDKEEAINMLIKEGKFQRKEAEIEILRYAVLPGQALTYKIGEKIFLNLKKKAKKTLKEKFNLKEFHKILLEDGSLPLGLLKEKVNLWIKKQLYL